MTTRVNIAHRLSESARRWPDTIGIAAPTRRDGYQQVTFAELDDDCNRLAAGFSKLGLRAGMRVVLMVRPGIDFFALTFALFRSGIVVILIDPGMGKRRLLTCLDEMDADGMIAVPMAHAVRVLCGRRFSSMRYNVTIGRRWFWGGETIARLRQSPAQFPSPETAASDPAAIIFTTGSTGPPKGVLYQHGNFDHQVTEIRDFYNIQPGEIDLPCFPLFGLFNAAMGVTTVIPDMDPTRPAKVDPRKIVRAIHHWKVTQTFASPAVWNVVGKYCSEKRVSLPTVRRVLSAGAPVPPTVLQWMKNVIHPQGDVHTPYGATESLPVSSISASEVLQETVHRSRQGQGTCVGRPFPGIGWRVIRIHEGPLASLSDSETLPPGEIGELIVQGSVVTTQYVTRTAANSLAKIPDKERFWHRMGDVGYLDKEGRFWFCGRKAHRVLTTNGPLYTVPCESIFNQLPEVRRSALVGVGKTGQQTPVLIVETEPDQFPRNAASQHKFQDLLKTQAAQYSFTRPIKTFLFHRSLPVDIRHNVKIFREQLASWAAKKLSTSKVHAPSKS